MTGVMTFSPEQNAVPVAKVMNRTAGLVSFSPSFLKMHKQMAFTADS